MKRIQVDHLCVVFTVLCCKRAQEKEKLDEAQANLEQAMFSNFLKGKLMNFQRAVQRTLNDKSTLNIWH